MWYQSYREIKKERYYLVLISRSVLGEYRTSRKPSHTTLEHQSLLTMGRKGEGGEGRGGRGGHRQNI